MNPAKNLQLCSLMSFLPLFRLNVFVFNLDFKTKQNRQLLRKELLEEEMRIDLQFSLQNFKLKS